MNIDFSDRPGFSFYVIFLMLAGIALVGLGGVPLGRRRSTPLRRVINILVGFGFFGYGFYLAFIFSGGHYVIFFYAFVLPIILIVRTLGGAAGSRRRAQPAAGQYGQPYAGQPYPGQPYPGQPYPGQPYPGQPYPGQPYPGQPYPGQPYPAQPYAAAPYPAELSTPASLPVTPAESLLDAAPAPESAPQPPMPVWPPPTG